MENINYFNDINEANKFIADNNINRNRVNDYDVEKYADYFAQFSKVEGCRVLIAGVFSEFRHKLYPCIEWNGVHMMLSAAWGEENKKTHCLRLVEDFDKKGINVWERYGDDQPNRIGSPTAKKLTDWAEWLTTKRRRAEEERDRIAARIPERIAECCRLFPEAANVEWKNSHWVFEKEFNGIKYILNINTDGNIYEKTTLSDQTLPISMAEKAARLMQNALQFCA